MISGVGQVAIRTPDLDKGIAFYRDVLGLPFLFQVPGMAFFQCGEVRLLLGPSEHPGGEHDHPASVLYYRVADIQAAYRALQDKGAEFLGEPHMVARLPDREVWMAFLRDGCGNTLAIMGEPPIAPS